MQEQLTDGADEQSALEMPGENTKRMRFARHVSNLLAPATISLPFILLVAFYQAPDKLSALIYACITFFFLSVGPLLYIIIGVRLGKLSDIDVSRRTQRFGPFLFGIASVTIGWIVLSLMNGPRNLQTVMIMTVFSGIIMMTITFCIAGMGQLVKGCPSTPHSSTGNSRFACWYCTNAGNFKDKRRELIRLSLHR